MVRCLRADGFPGPPRPSHQETWAVTEGASRYPGRGECGGLLSEDPSSVPAQPLGPRLGLEGSGFHGRRKGCECGDVSRAVAN